jgi:hypothetical protein
MLFEFHKSFKKEYSSQSKNYRSFWILTLISQIPNFLHLFIHLIHRDKLHAPPVIRALRLQAWGTGNGFMQDPAIFAERPRSPGIGRAENSDQRNPQGRRDVHQAGVIGDKEPTTSDDPDGLRQGRVSGQVNGRSLRLPAYLGSNQSVFHASQD